MIDGHFNEIVAEYQEAYAAAVRAEAAVKAAPENATLPQDVRNAKAILETTEEGDRLVAAKIAFDQANAQLQERWIAAHEILGMVRAAGGE
jgi:hypothetical protein